MEYNMAIVLTDEMMALPNEKFDEAMLTIARQFIGGANAKREELGHPARMGSCSRELRYIDSRPLQLLADAKDALGL